MAVAIDFKNIPLESNLLEERMTVYRRTYLEKIKSRLEELSGAREEEKEVRGTLKNYTELFGDTCPDVREIFCDALEAHVYDEDPKAFSTLIQFYAMFFSTRENDEPTKRFHELRSQRIDGIAMQTQAYFEASKKSDNKRRKFIRDFEASLKRGVSPGPRSKDRLMYEAAVQIERDMPEKDNTYETWFKRIGGKNYFDYTGEEPLKNER